MPGGRRTVLYRGWCHAMQAGMHSMHAALARAASNPDQNRPCKPNTVLWQEAAVAYEAKAKHSKPRNTAAQCRLTILTHLWQHRVRACSIADLPELHTGMVAYLQASHTHAHATHASRHFPYHHACIYTYIYTCGFSNAQLYLRDQLRAFACACRTCIGHILTSSRDSLFGRAERYYFHSGACAFS